MSLADDGLLRAAARLAGAPVRELRACAAGGNNRVFRVTCDAGSYALKAYRRSAADPRDRLGAEVAGLRYAASVAPGRVPSAVAVDAEAGLVLYEWIEGEPVEAHGSEEIAQALAFVRALHEGRSTAAASGIGPASEAILDPGDLREQLERRLEALSAVDDAALADLLRRRLRPLAARFVPSLRTVTALPSGERTLSPSDFGFHNALRRREGLVFLDFEYFGWDDPVKLVCDFLWHPGMRLGRTERNQFLAGATDVFKEGTSFQSRLAAYEPVIALRWAAIVLGEFLPEVRDRRKYAGRGADLDYGDVLRVQLAKAEAITDRLETEAER